ncbi:MAG: hypothetical protein IPJ21_18875 [Sterolibacteriaceae bacterium]|nr:hypothetical protein [Sterolibacteriaceae bacterium]MBK9085804.1 hypothetical protein [Sterolibacteriaceae bacterium]
MEQSGLAIGISTISLVVSLFTLWNSRLAPFKLHVRIAGRVDFVGNLNEQSAPSLVLPIIFSNSGAKPGYIEDLAVSMQPISGGNGRLFRALYEQSNLTVYSKEEVEYPEWLAFRSFRLNGDDSKSKQIVFTEFAPVAGTQFQPGTFELALHAMHSKSNGTLKREHRLQISLSSEELATLYPSGTVRLPTSVPLFSKMPDDFGVAFSGLATRIIGESSTQL